ncbi:hypothetical protein FO440_02335 [Mucilaginibacter corticis]|uniref:Uncharacterized protein n=1 Tax=Mucilaginibacter corticis TaxID=2597670 RepID=A0A556MTD1_9SPHI|nr:hypothetical protein [Mucilaginibacter corticis]TSJ43049.1 hypothetical protein FO440_02335 [Mucilaginibacter corticis]
MKKVLKIAGIAALVITLICNLEYAIFSGGMKSSPKALADWSGTSHGGRSGHWCGNSGDTTLHVGTWSILTYQVYGNYGYEHGLYKFTYDPMYGRQCAPDVIYKQTSGTTVTMYGSNCCGDIFPSGTGSYTQLYSPGGNTHPNPYPYPYYTTSPGGYTGYGPF